MGHLNRAFTTTQNKKPGGKSFVAEKFCQSLDFTLPTMEYSLYLEQMDVLINKDPIKLLKLAFDVFDFNQDGFIDEIDIFCVMKLCDLTSAKA
jgi:Ca2+-binding EF-hand superfamily protein